MRFWWCGICSGILRTVFGLNLIAQLRSVSACTVLYLWSRIFCRNRCVMLLVFQQVVGIVCLYQVASYEIFL